jgi:hypothetical protein
MARERDPGGFYLELYVDRGILRALTGGDASSDLDAADALLPTMEGDPQYASYVGWGRAWAALVAGDLVEARRLAERAADATSFFLPFSLPLAGRATLWSGDTAGAGYVITRLDASLHRGEALTLDRATLRAGLLRTSRRRHRRLPRCPAQLASARAPSTSDDRARHGSLLAPTEREMAEAATAIEAARETLTRLGAAPLLARLDAGPAAASGHMAPAEAGIGSEQASVGLR